MMWLASKLSQRTKAILLSVTLFLSGALAGETKLGAALKAMLLEQAVSEVVIPVAKDAVRANAAK